MREARRRAIGLTVVVSLASCGGDAGAGAPKPPRVSVDDLDEIPLRSDEAPAGTEYIAESSGPLEVEDIWDPACCAGQIEAFEDAGFVAAHGSQFRKPGHSGDPIDTRPGVEVLTSTAAMFATSTGASAAMDEWYAYYDSPVFHPLPEDGLGEDAIAVTGSPDAPAEVVYLYLWRIDRVVLSLRLIGGRGTIEPSYVRDLVDRMDRRAS